MSRRCGQSKCIYYQKGGCKSCEECKEQSYVINTSCNKCLSCENVPNSLRWGDNKSPIAETLKKKNKEKPQLIVEIKEEEHEPLPTI